MAVGPIPGVTLTSRAERGYTIAALTGKLDLASAPALRERLRRLLRPAAAGWSSTCPGSVTPTSAASRSWSEPGTAPGWSEASCAWPRLRRR